MSEVNFTNKYNTKLSTKDEKQFQSWLIKESAKQKRNIAADLNNYDLRGLFKESGGFGPNGHATDKYKKPNHPTFSTESIYNNKGFKGGKWIENKGKWTFQASKDNLKFYNKQALQDYFRKTEPDSVLDLSHTESFNPAIQITPTGAAVAQVDEEPIYI